MLLSTQPFWLADLVQGCIPYGQWGVFVELKEYLQLFQLEFFSYPVVGCWVDVFFLFFSLLSLLLLFICIIHVSACVQEYACTLNIYIYDGWDSKLMWLAKLFEN